MSPLSVAKVTSNLASGSISKAGALGMAVLRYRPCQRSPSTPASAASCATSSRSSAPTRPPSARDGPPRTWPPTSWCASATPRRPAGSCSADASRRTRSSSWSRRRPAATARLVDRVRNGPPLGPVRGPGPAHAAQPPGVRGAPRGRAAGQRPRASHRPPRPPGRPLGSTCAGARASCSARSAAPPCACSGPTASAITTGHGPEVVVTGEPVDLLLYLFGREEAAEVEITGDPEAQTILADGPEGHLSASDAQLAATRPRLRRPVRPSHSTAKSTSVARSSPESR